MAQSDRLFGRGSQFCFHKKVRKQAYIKRLLRNFSSLGFTNGDGGESHTKPYCSCKMYCMTLNEVEKHTSKLGLLDLSLFSLLHLRTPTTAGPTDLRVQLATNTIAPGFGNMRVENLSHKFARLSTGSMSEPL